MSGKGVGWMQRKRRREMTNKERKEILQELNEIRWKGIRAISEVTQVCNRIKVLEDSIRKSEKKKGKNDPHD